MTGVLVIFGGISLLSILIAVAWMIKGQPHMGIGGMFGLTMLLVWIFWYLNLLEVFRQLKRLDPDSYDSITGGEGFLSFFWSWGGNAYYLHRSLGALPLAGYPRWFRRRVKVTRLFTRVFFLFVMAAVTGLLVLAIVRRH